MPFLGLSPYRILKVEVDNVSNELIKILKSQDGNNDTEVDELYNTFLHTYSTLVDPETGPLSERKVLVFSHSIKSSEALKKKFEELLLSVKVGVIHSYKKAECNQEIIQDFNDDKIRVLINCGMLDEGSDLSGVGAIMHLAETGSEVKMIQRFGRGIRPPDDLMWVEFSYNAKKDAISALDMTKKSSDGKIDRIIDEERSISSDGELLIFGAEIRKKNYKVTTPEGVILSNTMDLSEVERAKKLLTKYNFENINSLDSGNKKLAKNITEFFEESKIKEGWNNTIPKYISVCVRGEERLFSVSENIFSKEYIQDLYFINNAKVRHIIEKKDSSTEILQTESNAAPNAISTLDSHVPAALRDYSTVSDDSAGGGGVTGGGVFGISDDLNGFDEELCADGYFLYDDSTLEASPKSLPDCTNTTPNAISTLDSHVPAALQDCSMARDDSAGGGEEWLDNFKWCEDADLEKLTVQNNGSLHLNTQNNNDTLKKSSPKSSPRAASLSDCATSLGGSR